MRMSSASPVQGGATPVPVLVHRVYLRRHLGCGRDYRETRVRYREGGYLAIEAIQRIDRDVERRRE
jgi:hypothetical protein